MGDSLQLGYARPGAFRRPVRLKVMGCISIVVGFLSAAGYAYLVQSMSGLAAESFQVARQNAQYAADARKEAEQMEDAAQAAEQRQPPAALSTDDAERGIDYIEKVRQQYLHSTNVSKAPLSPKQHATLMKILQAPGQTLYEPSMKLPVHAERSGAVLASMSRDGSLWINLGHGNGPYDCYSFQAVIDTDGRIRQGPEMHTPAYYYKERAAQLRSSANRPVIDGPSYENVRFLRGVSATGCLLGILLAFTGMALLRSWPYACKAHKIYACLQLGVGILLMTGVSSLRFDGPAGPEYDFGMEGLIPGAVGCIYPVVILLVLRPSYDTP